MIHISRAGMSGSTAGTAPSEVYLPINEQMNMGFVAPALTPAYPPGHLPGATVGIGATGGHHGPPW
eukprot:7097090-Karenia_brevis.AAC.1